jgi:hypothetical protein
MSRIKLFNKFINKEDCEELHKWIVLNRRKNFFKKVDMEGERWSTRFSSDLIFPGKSFEIRNKIIDAFNLKNFCKEEFFYKGMVASYASPGDTCYLHTDPVYVANTKTLHFNIKLSNNLGGNPILSDTEIPTEQGDMWSYFVSEIEHGSSLVYGHSPRTMWVFGFSVNENFTFK